MSSALAIAAVTASLKDLINDGLIDHDLSSVGSFSVSALPPDRVATGGTEANALNLFLYQITANSGWRNAGLPSRDRTGVRLSSPPLALDLHYLLTAYGSHDLNAEVLLGYAMHVLHETPVLTRGQLRAALGAPAPVDGVLLPGPFGALSALDLADQVEQIKITPVFLGTDDLSKLWAAMQARYRPSMAYAVSVVLIQSRAPARAALPVLQRGKDDRGPVAQGAPAPVLASVRSGNHPLQPALRLGEQVVIDGSNLRASTVRFECTRLGVVRDVAADFAAVANADGSPRLVLQLPTVAQDPNALAAWAAGVYGVSLRISAADTPTWTTNAVPVALAPTIAIAPLAHAVGTVDIDVTCTPRLRPEQEADARLLFGAREVLPSLIDTPANVALPTTLSFSIPDVIAGDYVVRLRVDGIDSLPIQYQGAPAIPSFDPQQTVSVT